MSNKDTYKNIFVDNKYRNAQLKSLADFSVELNENSEIRKETKFYIIDTSIPAVRKSTEVGIGYELMRQGRGELMNDTDKKQRYRDEKTNNFARNLNEQFRQNT